MRDAFSIRVVTISKQRPEVERRALTGQRRSFRLNRGCLHDRPPFLDLGLVNDTEPGWPWLRSAWRRD
jgi:hypothetical protein